MDREYNSRIHFTQNTLSPLSTFHYHNLLFSIKDGSQQILRIRAIRPTENNTPTGYKKSSNSLYYKAYIKDYKTGKSYTAVLSHIQAENVIRIQTAYSKRIRIKRTQTPYSPSHLISNSSQRDPKPVKQKDDKKTKKDGDKS
ncbi:MAG: hypothetical protein E7513_07810 [Ruminococcaceae bacterium]|nr:hypothetical protein [Oscillospiraceae bacterium]